MSTYAIESTQLGKRYPHAWAVREVGLTVPPGQVYGFLGPNGSGKTTTIRMLLGLLKPSSGTVRIFGHDVATERMAAARLTGSLLEARGTYDNLSGRDNLDTTRRLLRLPATEIDRVLDIVDLRADAGRRVAHYSLGMRQRLGLARALLGAPKLLVLDEPMNGLDPDGIRDMRQLIRELPARSAVTLFLSSHLLSEVQQTATHIGLMDGGRLVLQGALAELLAQAGPRLFIRAGGGDAWLKAHGHAPVHEGDGWLVHADNDAEAAAINRGMVAAGIEVVELSLRQPTLESLYLQHRPLEAA
jgi:ABC-2 type transport system ATP-binding protein